MDIPLEYLEIGEEIMDEARLSLGKALNDNIYISMVNHIYTAVVRAKDDILVKNALLWDIQKFYKEEYLIVKKALVIIEKKTGVLLPNDEAGFIALHIVNGQLDEDVHDMYEITKIMQEIENIVRYRFKIEFNEESAYYYCFITHLKFFAQRLVEYKKTKQARRFFNSPLYTKPLPLWEGSSPFSPRDRRSPGRRAHPGLMQQHAALPAFSRKSAWPFQLLENTRRPCLFLA